MKQKKSVKKRGRGILLILNLVLSIFAFCFLVSLNSEIISGDTAVLDPSWLGETPAPNYFADLGGVGGASIPTHGIYGSTLKSISPEFAATRGGFAVSGIAQAAGWGLAVYFAVKMIGGWLGIGDAKVDAAALAAGFGTFAGMSLSTLFGAGSTVWPVTWMTTGMVTGIGIVIAIIIFVILYKDVEQQVISFNCVPWDARTGGSDCEKCNKQGILPCSEYQCRSLGQACQLLNKGTKDEKCTWVNPKDVDPPVIKPNKDALLDGYIYKPDNTISPPNRGVIVLNQESKEGCAKAFTPLAFGVELDEPAKCKLDYLRKDSFDEMDFFFGDSLFAYNHTIAMSLPGPDNIASENLTIQNDGEYEIYSRCQDANGNSNTANFVFKFCVEKGPDTTPPLIVTTNLLNGMPIAYNQTSVDLEVYVNEPAECKWSHLDQNYDDMEESMSCSSRIIEMNALMLYTCKTTLTGLKNNQENKFYFRCKDKPLETQDRNVNAESYEFILIGTQPLVIDSVGPNGTIKDSTDIIKVELKAETSAGYKEGESTCYYSSTGNQEDYIMFLYETGTSSHEHTQELHLPQGEYEYFIKCIDLGGNSDTEKVNFNVESDTSSPIVVRAYHDAPYLKLVTNEEAECVYDTRDCSYLFDDGTKISATDDTEHFTDWNTKTNFYIKCQDEYGNQPAPNECSIIVRAFNQE